MRMELAMDAADRCLEHLMHESPEFVERYLLLSEELLRVFPYVTGDKFKSHCNGAGLFLPKGLHHNSWVSCVRFLEGQRWIKRKRYVVPSELHNHMPRVTEWQSLIYWEVE